MENIVDVDMKSCKPDSTVEVIEIDDTNESQDATPLRAMHHQLVERQCFWVNRAAAAAQKRERLRSQLDEVGKQRESDMADFRLWPSLCTNVSNRITAVTDSLDNWKERRLGILKELDAESMRRSPIVEMSVKKQQALRERVEVMRIIQDVGEIPMPDDD